MIRAVGVKLGLVGLRLVQGRAEEGHKELPPSALFRVRGSFNGHGREHEGKISGGAIDRV